MGLWVLPNLGSIKILWDRVLFQLFSFFCILQCQQLQSQQGSLSHQSSSLCQSSTLLSRLQTLYAFSLRPPSVPLLNTYNKLLLEKCCCFVFLSSKTFMCFFLYTFPSFPNTSFFSFFFLPFFFNSICQCS